MKTIALIIDDNLNNLLLEKDLLEVAGFTVLVAEDASNGIRLATSEQPHIILMDIRLPDMRGTEAAKVLQSRPETQHIPVVFVTASVLAEGIAEIMAVPNAVVITKPINTRTFAERIRQVLPGESTPG